MPPHNDCLAGLGQHGQHGQQWCWLRTALNMRLRAYITTPSTYLPMMIYDVCVCKIDIE